MTTHKPLNGFTVVDFSAVFAGPICSRFMLDCGADVIKIETPVVGDLTRGVDGLSRVFAQFNAGKPSIAIDLKHASGQALAQQLIEGADVVIQNFRPGIMAKFGLDYDSLRHQRPDLVYCSISGFGLSGPYVDRAAFAPIVHAASGFDSVHSLAQEGSDRRPANWEIMVADMLTGAYAFGAIQTALLSRERSGVGEHVDISMMESMMTLIPAHIQAEQMEEPPVIGRYCPVKTQDGFVMVCVVSDKNMQSLCAALKRPELMQDPRFVRSARLANVGQLATEIERWSASLTAAECEKALNHAGVPCSVYQRTQDLFAHPQVVERNSFTTLSNDQLGDFLIQNMPVKFQHSDNTAASWVAKLGEHTDAILRERLQLAQAEIDSLRSEGIVS